MPHSEFKRINEERDEEGLPTFVNPSQCSAEVPYDNKTQLLLLTGILHFFAYAIGSEVGSQYS